MWAQEGDITGVGEAVGAREVAVEADLLLSEDLLQKTRTQHHNHPAERGWIQGDTKGEEWRAVS